MPRLVDMFRQRVRSVFRARQVDDDLARELRAHLEEETAANIDRGMTPPAAREAALRAFGSVTAVEEACRDTRRVGWVQSAIRDARYAVRTLARERALLMAATASIALGAGANLTIFSIANALLLATPSARSPQDLVHIRTGNGSHVSYRG
ncbi:MAG TPA: permease prefix domain 1-containing protein [Vicinamibacterales bacterium]|nr:permease prefix domain 1-containing protein [Vicinamibacterales bacterium]